ncbi:MAG: hypothetical protein HY662_03485 [Chloroflexi bacterium]|nr:hypothetical protein [Chloroflexota bacterium]
MGWKIKDVFMTDTGEWLGQEFLPEQIHKIIPRLQKVAEVEYSYALYTDISLAAVLDSEGLYESDINVYAVPRAFFSVEFDDYRGNKWSRAQVYNVCKVQDIIPTKVLVDIISGKATLGIRLSSLKPPFSSPQEIPVCLHSELSSNTTIVIKATSGGMI